jgi:hypothetical protein
MGAKKNFSPGILTGYQLQAGSAGRSNRSTKRKPGEGNGDDAPIYQIDQIDTLGVFGNVYVFDTLICLWSQNTHTRASFKTLDQLLAALAPAIVASIMGYSFILNALPALNTL